jgi:hypothetical protein
MRIGAAAAPQTLPTATKTRSKMQEYKAECGFNLRPTYLRQQRRVDDLDEWNILNRFGADDWSEFRACFADRKVSRV